MLSSLTIGAVSLGLWLSIQFVRMIIKGRELRADKWTLLSTSSPIRSLFPSTISIRGVFIGLAHQIRSGHADFREIGKDGYVEVSVTNPGVSTVFIADPQAYKEVARLRAPFVRDVELMRRFIGIFGENMLTLEHDEWKHHRKIGQRGFTEKTPQLVWTETTAALEKLYELWDTNGDRVCVKQAKDMTETLTLMVISAAILGQRLSWVEEDEEAWPGYDFSFQKTLRTVSRNIMAKVFTPKWAEDKFEKTRTVTTGFVEFDKYLREMLEANRSTEKSGSKAQVGSSRAMGNVFDVLSAANDEDQVATGKGLADSEVIGNAFLFLFAGHETTASALAFALGLLALHPDIQQEAYAEVKRTMGSRSCLDYSDVEGLKFVTGVLLESLRIRSPVSQIFRYAAQDTTLTVARNDPNRDTSQRETIVVPEGTYIVASISAIHANPTYWPEPEKFRPSRFMGNYNRDAFLPFSNGGKACIGQKFAETEGIATLASILSRYEVSIDATLFPEVPGESIQDRQTRLIDAQHLLSVVPRNIPLVFTRRI